MEELWGVHFYYLLHLEEKRDQPVANSVAGFQVIDWELMAMWLEKVYVNQLFKTISELEYSLAAHQNIPSRKES